MDLWEYLFNKLEKNMGSLSTQITSPTCIKDHEAKQKLN